MATTTKLNPIRRSQAAHRKEMLRYFRDRRNPNTPLGRVCIAAHAKLVELQKDSARTNDQKQAIFKLVVDEVKVNLWAEQERQKFADALDAAEAEKTSEPPATPAPIGFLRSGPDIPW